MAKHKAGLPGALSTRHRGMQTESKGHMRLLEERNAYELQQLHYDYALIAEEHREQVRSAAVEIRQRLKRTVEDMIEIGRQLNEVKDHFPHGEFEAWAMAEFGMSKGSMSEFRNIANRFGEKSSIIDDLNPDRPDLKRSNFERLLPSVVRRLAAPSVPDVAVTAVLAATEAGEKQLAYKDALAIVRPYLPEKRPKPLPPPEPEIIEAAYQVLEESERIIAMLADPHTTPVQLSGLFAEATAAQLEAALQRLPEDADLRHDSIYRQMLKARALADAQAALLRPPAWETASDSQVDLLARVIAMRGTLRDVEQQQPGLHHLVDDVQGPLKRLIVALEGKLR